MSKVFSLFLFVPLFFIMMTSVMWMQFYQYQEQEVADDELKAVVNYSVDSAIEELLEAADLGMDYADWGKMKVDPKLALDDFINTFLMNYDMPITDDNKSLVRSAYMPVFCVAAFDGYYMYDRQKVNKEGDFELLSSPKIPYTYNKGQYTYALNMGFNKCYAVLDNSVIWTNNPIGKKETLKIINTRISDDFASRVDSAYKNGWASSVFIPAGIAEVSRTQPIQSPAVLAFVDNVDLYMGHNISCFGIGGARVKTVRAVAAYQRDGTKYYAYADLLPAELFNTDGSPVSTYIEDMFSTVQDAAQAGYHHDTLYMN